MSINLQAKVTDSTGAIATKDFSIFVPTPGGTDYVVPLSIDPTGTQEVSLALLAWLQTVPDGSTIQFPDGATYWCENTLPIHNRIDLTIMGNGATIEARTDGSTYPGYPGQKRHLWPRTRTHLEIRGTDGLWIEDLIVRGANPNAGPEAGGYVSWLEGQHAYEVGTDSQNVTIKTCEGYDVYGDLIYVGKRASAVRVLGGRYDGTGRQGWAITGCVDVVFDGVYVDRIARSMVDIEPAADGAVVDNIVIRNCEFGDCRHLWVTSGGKGTVGNVLVENNVIHGVGMKVVVTSSPQSSIQRRGPHAFLNNTCDAITGGPQPFFRFKRVDGVTVTGNSGLHQERGVPGVRTCECTDVSVSGNTFTGVTVEHEDLAVCL